MASRKVKSKSKGAKKKITLSDLEVGAGGASAVKGGGGKSKIKK